MWTTAANVLLAAVLASPDAASPMPATSREAETSPSGRDVEPGATVRLFSPVASDWRTGTVLATRGSEWQIRVRGSEPVWVDIRDYSRVEVLRRRGLSVEHGLGLGLVLGFLLGWNALDDDCLDEHLDNSCRAPKAFFMSAIGGGLGVASAMLFQRERWMAIGHGVAVSVQPASDRRGGGVAAVLRVRF